MLNSDSVRILILNLLAREDLALLGRMDGLHVLDLRLGSRARRHGCLGSPHTQTHTHKNIARTGPQTQNAQNAQNTFKIHTYKES